MSDFVKVKSVWIFTKIFHTLEIHHDSLYYSFDFPTKNFRRKGVSYQRLENIKVTTSLIDLLLLYTTRTLVITSYDTDLQEIRYPGVKTFEAITIQQKLEPLTGKGVVKFESNSGD